MKTFCSPYELVLREIEAGRVNPFDVDIEYLVELFRSVVESLSREDEYLREAGRFLEAGAKLLKLQTNVIFPPEPKEKKKITVKEVVEVLKEGEEDIHDLSFVYEYTVPAGRPRGSTGSVSEKPAKFIPEEFKGVLHGSVDYMKLAEEVRRKIKEGTFKIRNVRDFIAYLFAYFEFEDVPELDLKSVCS